MENQRPPQKALCTDKVSGDKLQFIRELTARFPIGCACFQTVFDHRGDIDNYIFLAASSSLEEIAGCRQEQLAGKKITEVFSLLGKDICERLLKAAARVYRSEEKSMSFSALLFSRMYQATLFYAGDILFFCICKEIDALALPGFFRPSAPERAALQNFSESLELPPGGSDDALFRDPLTGLYDRFFAMEALNRYIDRGAFPLTVVLGDVNRLVMTDSDRDYEADEQVILRISQILLRHCGEKNLVARWNEDEFLLLLPCTSAEEAQNLLNRLHAELDGLFATPEGGLITFGYATSEKAPRSAEALIQEAENWLCRKKILINQSYWGSILKLLLATLRKENKSTVDHSNHMAALCRRIAEKLCLTEEATNDLVLLSALHDIGKIGIRHEILRKPGSLTAKERQEIDLHPEIGYQITRNIPELSRVSEYILSHHERWDGTGYPNRLQAERIPLASRIIAVIDAYDVMVSGRVYQVSRSRQEAVAELKRCAGTQFDPEIVRIFTEMLERDEVPV